MEQTYEDREKKFNRSKRRKQRRKRKSLFPLFPPVKSGPGGVVELDFDKSVGDGVNIYAKRGDEADFSFLARDTASP